MNQSVAPGTLVTFPIQVTPANGFTGGVTFNPTTLTPCGHLVTPPASVTGAGNTSFKLDTTGCASSTTPLHITVFGTGYFNGESVNATVTVNLTIVSGVPDFTITASPSAITLAPGVSDVYTIQVNSLSGFMGAVALSATTTAPGATVSFVYGSTVTGAGKAFLRVKTVAGTGMGSYPITVTGTSGGVTRTWPMTVTVATQADFSLGDLNIPNVPIGGSVSVPIPVTLYGSSPVQMRPDIDMPPGLEVTFDSSILAQAGVVVMNISAGNSVLAGIYPALAEGTDVWGGSRHAGGPIVVGGGGGGITGFYLETLEVSTQPVVMNDNQPRQFGPYYAYSPGGTPAQRQKYPSGLISSCSAGPGVTAVMVPRQNDPIQFDVSYTAPNNTLPGDRTLRCTVSGYQAAPAPGYPNQGVSVYDATPHIDLMTQTDPSTGTFTITGDHFGPTPGNLAVCAGGPWSTACNQTPDFSTPTIVLWTNTAITAILAPFPTASGRYCVQVKSSGQSGHGFAFAPGGASTDSTCGGDVEEAPPAPSVIISINATSDTSDDITVLTPAQTIPVQVTLAGGSGVVRLSVNPAGRASINQADVTLAAGGSQTVTLTPLQQSQVANDVQIVATFNGSPVGQARMTIVNVTFNSQNAANPQTFDVSGIRRSNGNAR